MTDAASRKAAARGVALLGKGYGHSLRTAPCLESSGMLCIRNYYVDRVLELDPPSTTTVVYLSFLSVYPAEVGC